MVHRRNDVLYIPACAFDKLSNLLHIIQPTLDWQAPALTKIILPIHNQQSKFNACHSKFVYATRIIFFMDLPSCVRICENEDLKTAAEIAFTRGSLEDRNKAALDCMTYNKKHKVDSTQAVQDKTDKLRQYMKFVDTVLSE